IAAYQKGLVPLLIQASPTPHLLLYAIEVGDFLDSVKKTSFYSIINLYICKKEKLCIHLSYAEPLCRP
ncbi:hypothetical protein KQI69_07950, partial [Eubacterium sp. MSJ-13]|uniref:hypothetical protein n=1 Tax=Eubacterium sp. MSJ-13 TaxID=2841513 RepID=UPI001C1175D8